MKTIYLTSLICVLFFTNNINAQKIYEGNFSTEYFRGKAKYAYNEAPDGSRIYNGIFSFEGNTEYIDEYYDYWVTIGKYRTNTEWKYDMDVHEKYFKKYGKKINIQGNYLRGNKNGLWHYVIYSINPQSNKWIPTDSIIINYNNGILQGVCTYKKYSIRKKLLKTEEVTFRNDKAHGKSIIKYRKNDGSFETFEATFDYGKPIGIWKSRNWEGTTMIYDCDKCETKWFNDETGQWSRQDGWSGGGLKSSYNHHGFTGNGLYNDYYMHRIGGLKMGEHHEYHDNWRNSDVHIGTWTYE